MLFNNYNTLVPHKYLRFIQCIIYTFISTLKIFFVPFVTSLTF